MEALHKAEQELAEKEEKKKKILINFLTKNIPLLKINN